MMRAACFFAAAPAAFASTGELFGLGSRAAGMGNTMLGGATDSFATYYNSAANSTHPGLSLSIGTAWAHMSFLDIKNVVIANNATTAKQGDVYGDVDTGNYLDFLEQMIGTSLNLGENWKELTAGFAVALPLARIAYIDTGDPFLPEYISYRSRTQRPQIYVSLSATPLTGLHLGMGLSIFTNLSATTNAFITSSSASVSHQQFASTIKPGVAPYFSAYADPKPLSLGTTIRLPAKAKVDIDTNASARVLGNVGDLPLVVNSSSTIYYDPLEIDFAIGYEFTPKLFATLEADWLQYKVFEPPTLMVTDLGSGPKLHNSIDTTPEMQNIFIPKGGIEFKGETITLRTGYMYRQSPVKDNSGPGNLVDPARHTFTAGLGIDLKKAKLTERDIVLDLHAQYHWLVEQHIAKGPPNEAGTANSGKIGSPGYDIGGSIYGGGFSLTASF